MTLALVTDEYVTAHIALEAELSASREELVAIANLGQVALSGASTEAIFGLTSSIVTDVLGADLCAILEYRGDHFRVAGGSSWIAGLGPIKASEPGQAAYALRTCAPLVVEDLATETRFTPWDRLLRDGITGGVTVPVIIGHSEKWGTLSAHTRSRRPFSASDVDFLRAVAGVLGQAVMRNRADQELLARAMQQSAISELSRLALKSFDDATLVRACELIRRCLGVDDVTFTAVDVGTGFSPSDGRYVVPVVNFGTISLTPPAHPFGTADIEFLQAVANIVAEGLGRDRAARALAASEQSYREVVEGASEAIFTLSMDGKFTSLNAAFEKVTGWPASEWVGRPYLQLIHPSEHLHSREVFRAVVERQESAADTLKIIAPDDIRMIELTSFPKVENGRTTAIYGFARDVTKAQQAERERQQLTRSLQLLLESTVEGILTFDTEGRCTMVNRAAAQILGRTREAILRDSVHELLHAQHGRAVMCEACAILEVAATGAVRSVANETFWRSDGTPVPVEYSAAPVIDDGVPVGVVVSFNDITDRLRLEAKLAQANRLSSLGRLAATVAHEFNNVLMGIAPFVEVIRRGKNVEVAVDHISQAIKRGKRITEDILRFTQPAEPLRMAFDVEPWLQNVFLEARSLLPAHCTVDLVVEDPRLRVDGDANQLQQVFTNLVLNARDAMPEGGTLTIGVCRESAEARLPFAVQEPERFAHFIVRDTGRGMTTETLRHIFEPLFTTKKSGTGLGLSVAHQVVTRHSGEIFVESVLGMGTTFHIFLPLAAGGEMSVHLEEESSWIPPEGFRVLLVEDDKTVSAGLTSLLTLEKIGVKVAESGVDAIRSVHTERFDLVVLDVGLPDMDGTNVYSAIAAMRPDLPVIFSTGHADRTKVDSMVTRDNVAFLQKPYDCSALLAAMQEVMVETRNAG